MRKYQAKTGPDTITPIEVKRETETSIYVAVSWGDIRSDKISERIGYFDTFEDARAFLLEKREWNVSALIRSMEREMGKIEAVKKMEAT